MRVWEGTEANAFRGIEPGAASGGAFCSGSSFMASKQ